jgi:hypothetical protein
VLLLVVVCCCCCFVLFFILLRLEMLRARRAWCGCVFVGPLTPMFLFVGRGGVVVVVVVIVVVI